MDFQLQLKTDLFAPLEGECHASTLVALPDGFAAAWFQGSKEGRPDVAIYGSRTDADGHWSRPVRWAKVNDRPHWNPVLFLAAPQRLLLFFKVSTPDGERWQTWLQESADGGRTWTPAMELVPGAPDARGPVKNKPIRLSDGAVLAGNSLEDVDYWRVLTDRSEDNGRSWHASEVLRQLRASGDLGVIQPTLWEAPPGQVHMLTRSTSGRIYRSDSVDFGRSWAPLFPTNLPNNNSGIDLAQAPDGRLLLAYNNTCDCGRRNPLTLAGSDDNGATWQKLLDLETENGEFSYPAVIPLGGNRFAGTYTNRRRTITLWQGTLNE